MMERVGALETTFLGLETPTVSFVYACIIELDRAIDVEALRGRVVTALDAIPRYRQRIVQRRFRRPVWEEDRDFAIEHHVREARVDPSQRDAPRDLEALAGELLGTEVPREHSPWCMWTVRGLPGGRGAVIALVHHALGDGLAGLRLLDHLFGAAPTAHSTSRPRPRLRDLLSWQNARGLVKLLRDGLRPGPDIGLNPRVVARDRLFASYAVSLAELRAIREATGATLNDVLLAAIAGALRRYVERHGRVAAHGVRAMVPVGRHASAQDATIGNRVALALAPLPVDEPDPRARIARIHSGMHQARRGIDGGELLVAAADLIGPTVLTATFRTALRLRAYNTIVTNVPGPTSERSLLDARVTAITPIVNLWPHEALGFAATSYAGTLHIGIQADRVHVPDLADLRDDLAASFRELAGVVAHAA